MRRSLMLLATGTLATILPSPAFAQDAVRAQLPPGAVVQPLDDGPAGELRRSLTALGENPRSLEALVNAGRAALALGDPQAALTFLSRAEEVSPGDPRVEAGMGSAMVRVGQPRAALTLFQEAVAHGAPEVEIAADRGLAYDLSGEPRRAQQDYNLALRRRDDPELRRRLALSLAISGQREPALRVIEPQLRRNERAAWRTQAFILALTGDTQGATRTARDVMPAGIAEAMSPFLERLAGLEPAQKAAAVHLGAFPSDGRSTAFASVAPPRSIPYSPPAASPPARPRLAEAETVRERRRPGNVSPLEAAAVGGRSRPAPDQVPPDRVAEADTRRFAAPEIARRNPSPLDRAAVRPQQEPSQPRVAATETRRFAPPETAPARQSPPAAGTPAPRRVEPAPTTPVRIAEADRPRFAPATGQAPGQTQTDPAAYGPPAPAAPAPGSADAISMPLPAQSRPTIETVTPPASQPALDAAADAARTDPPAPAPSIAPAVAERVAAAELQPTPGFTLAPQPATSPPAAASPTAAPNRTGLADIAAVLEDLPSEQSTAPRIAAATPPPAPAARTRPAPARGEPNSAPSAREIRTATAGAAQRAARNRTPAPPANPSRHWVQVAGGANRAALGIGFATIRDRAPELLRNRTPYTTPLRATNRILVGPFRTPAEAQAFVNQLAARNVPAFAWTSEAGQEIARIQMPR